MFLALKFQLFLTSDDCWSRWTHPSVCMIWYLDHSLTLSSPSWSVGKGMANVEIWEKKVVSPQSAPAREERRSGNPGTPGSLKDRCWTEEANHPGWDIRFLLRGLCDQRAVWLDPIQALTWYSGRRETEDKNRGGGRSVCFRVSSSPQGVWRGHLQSWRGGGDSHLCHSTVCQWGWTWGDTKALSPFFQHPCKYTLPTKS